MKSIKEQSNEYAKEYLFRTLSQRAPNIHFEAGANYVLDEIEKIICHPLRFVNANKTIEEGMIEEISKLLEQLKK